MLDASFLVGNVPARFEQDDALDQYFFAARGIDPKKGAHQAEHSGCAHASTAPASIEGAAAHEMTKWFDTNYHYLVPEFDEHTQFSLHAEPLLQQINEAQQLAADKVKPVVIGPITYLYLGRSKQTGFDRIQLIGQLVPVYQKLLQQLADAGIEWVQIDEPILALDLEPSWRDLFESVYNQLQGGPKLLLTTYFGGLGDNLPTVMNLPVAGLHIDCVRGDELQTVLDQLPVYKVLSLGLINGRNIWRNDQQYSSHLIDQAKDLGDRLWLSTSCSLLHVPVDKTQETRLDAVVYDRLAFANQKLEELTQLKAYATGNVTRDQLHTVMLHHAEQNHQAKTQRASDYAVRAKLQQQVLKLPLYPTTTIGSFPQTTAIRQARQQFKQGKIDAQAYDQFLKDEIRDVIHRQEQLDLDVLVHGEAERNDMVEYFGEQLDGFAFTQYGWVQSYGSRCVKPPIIYTDVKRPHAMTVDWIRYAQSLTTKKVKGMLTGPVTILQWSFVREDYDEEVVCRQIALAIRDEVLDLEKAGISIIQIDEPAYREGMPLRKADQQHYLNWAAECFRMTASEVQDQTQIHTHMCYSDFNSIIADIAAMDADVITIESARSDMQLLQAFKDFNYPNAIGPGVYDIHSPRVPETNSMVSLLDKALNYLQPEQLWVNPDCGLKTRNWEETEQSLQHMVDAAKVLRQKADQKNSEPEQVSA